MLIGDPHQLGTIDRAGGMLGPLADALHAPSLDAVHRFYQDWERTASLLLRAGNPRAIDHYTREHRLHQHADTGSAQQAVLGQWKTAIDRGQQVLLLARSRSDVTELNTLAREHLHATGIIHGPVLVTSGAGGRLQWQAGDRLRATRNNRQLPRADGYVRNGDLFTVLGPGPDGGLRVAHDTSATVIDLPADYVHAHATYGWASTIDSAQGATTDIGILLARPGLDREHLYVGLTRGRTSNHLHFAPTETREPHHLPEPTAGFLDEVLGVMLASTGIHAAAHTRLTDHDREQLRFTPETIAGTQRGTHVRSTGRQSAALLRQAHDNHAPHARDRGIGR